MGSIPILEEVDRGRHVTVWADRRCRAAIVIVAKKLGVVPFGVRSSGLFWR
jgi:hypothetical protein